MHKEAFQRLEMKAHLRFLADIRGVPKDTIVAVEEIDQAGDGTGNGIQRICRVRVVKAPKGSRKMPFMDHLFSTFERDAKLLEQVKE